MAVPGGMSFELTEDQELIRKSVAELMASRIEGLESPFHS